MESIPCSWIGRINIVKTTLLPKAIYRFNAIPIKIPTSYFVAVYKLFLNIIWRGKRPRIDNTILKEKNKVGQQVLSNFKTY